MSLVEHHQELKSSICYTTDEDSAMHRSGSSQKHAFESKSPRFGSSTPVVDVLPPEIMTSIFMLALPSIEDLAHEHASVQVMDFEDHMESLEMEHNAFLLPLVISSVSTKWRTMALGCPLLWSKVSINFCDAYPPLSVLGQWLDRSKTTPLTIIIQSDKSKPRTAHLVLDECTKTIQKLFDAARRWKHLFLLGSWGLNVYRYFMDPQSLSTLSASLLPRSFGAGPVDTISVPILESVCVHVAADVNMKSFHWLRTVLAFLRLLVRSAPNIRSLHWQEDHYNNDLPVDLLQIKDLLPMNPSGPLLPRWTSLTDVYLRCLHIQTAAELLVIAPRLENANFSFSFEPSSVRYIHGWQEALLKELLLDTITVPHMRSLRLHFMDSLGSGENDTETPKMLLDLISACSLKELVVSLPICFAEGTVDASLMKQSISGFLERSRCVLTHFFMDHHPNDRVEDPTPLLPPYPHESPILWQAITHLHLSHIPSLMVIEQLPYIPNLIHLNVHLLTLGSEQAGVCNPVVQLPNGPTLLPKLSILIIKGISDFTGVTRIWNLLDSITAPALETFGMAAMKGEWPVQETLDFLDRSQCRIVAIDINVPPSSFVKVLEHPQVFGFLRRLAISPRLEEVDSELDFADDIDNTLPPRVGIPHRRAPHSGLLRFLQRDIYAWSSPSLPFLSELILGVVPPNWEDKLIGMLQRRRPKGLDRCIVFVDYFDPYTRGAFGDTIVMGRDSEDLRWARKRIEDRGAYDEDDEFEEITQILDWPANPAVVENHPEAFQIRVCGDSARHR